MSAVSFRCTACGKCCNSVPIMSLPELFHHQHLFVGALAIRRVPHYRSGDRIHSGAIQHVLSEPDLRELEELADTLHFGGSTAQVRFSILTQAFDYPSLNRCPALREDSRCGIHHDRKPEICRVVPFDAALPDRLQHAVLLNRNISENYFGANCIVAGESDAHEVVVRDLELVDAEAAHAIARRRHAIQFDKRYWGEAVFGLLKHELFVSADAAAKIPLNGFMSLSIVPALAVIAGVSEACHRRCLQYLDAQIGVIDRNIELALLRKRSQDIATTRELRAFKTAHLNLQKSLNRGVPNVPARLSDPLYASGVEAYLGLR